MVTDIAAVLEKEGITLTPGAIRARLKSSMTFLAERSCDAIGVELDEEEVERIGGSRSFHEAVAAMLEDEATS